MSSLPSNGTYKPWLMWGLGAAFFFSMYIARVSPGVMSFELMRSFHVSATELGSLVAFFYVPYVCMQIPVGILIDRFGPRRLLTLMLLLCAFACFLFSQTDNLSIVFLSRALLGFGAAFAFVGALKLATIWFPPHRIGLLAGFTQALGMLGASVGQHPTAMLVGSVGWRDTLLVFMAGFILLAILIAVIVRDFPAGFKLGGYTAPSTKSLFAGVKKVLANPQTWLGGMYAGMLYAPSAAFGELWGNSYLRAAYGYSMETAAFGIGLIFIGWGIGGPLMGWISDKVGRRKPFMYFSAIMSCVLLLSILYFKDLPLSTLYTLLFFYGVCNTGVVLAYALVSEANSRLLAGTSLGIANMLSIMIGTLFQPLIGAILDLLNGVSMIDDMPVYVMAHFRTAMTLLPACLMVAVILLIFVKETRCQPLEDRE